MEKCEIWKCIFGRPKAFCAFVLPDISLLAEEGRTTQWEKRKLLRKSFLWIQGIPQGSETEIREPRTDFDPIFVLLNKT